MSRPRTPYLLAAAALWSALVIAGAFWVPLYGGTTTTTQADGSVIEVQTRASLVEVNGTWGLIVAAIPGAITLIVALLLARRRRIPWVIWPARVAVGLLGVFCLLAMLTVGLYLAPVVALLALAVLLEPSPTLAT